MFLNTDPLAYNPTINVWNLESPMTSSQPIEICSFASDNCDDQYWHGGISSFNGKLFFIDYDYNSSVERKDGTWQKAYTVRAIVNISEMPSVWKGLDHVRLDSDGMENRAIKEVLTDGGKKELCFATEEEAKPFLKDF
ncbi:MAG: hypothetical protein FWF24_04490, partial [Alphaproteobacteria bacterium]|nr:hypothetical protein [Alphaproteobacteria bacterium]